MMKKVILTTTTTILSSILLAQTPNRIINTDKMSEGIGTTTKESFIYNKGFKDGHETGKREGYALAKKEAEKSLARWAKKIKSMEASKYLVRKGKITPPRLYQKRVGGHVEVIIKGCEVRGELSPADILKLPSVGEETETNKIYTETNSNASAISDSVFLAGASKKPSIAIPTQSLKNKTTLIFKDTKFFRDLLRASGIMYSIEANGGGARATFRSPQEANSFIKNYGLSKGRDYL